MHDVPGFLAQLMRLAQQPGSSGPMDKGKLLGPQKERFRVPFSRAPLCTLASEMGSVKAYLFRAHSVLSPQRGNQSRCLWRMKAAPDRKSLRLSLETLEAGFLLQNGQRSCALGAKPNHHRQAHFGIEGCPQKEFGEYRELFSGATKGTR